VSESNKSCFTCHKFEGERGNYDCREKRITDHDHRYFRTGSFLVLKNAAMAQADVCNGYKDLRDQ